MSSFASATTPRLHDGRWVATTTEDWGQGRALFGGATGAIALRTLAALVPPERAPRSVLLNFVGPIAPGEVEVVPSVLRAGRALTQAQAEVRQGDSLAATVVAAFGAPRATRIHVPGPPPPAGDRPEQLQALPYLPGVTPVFTQHYAYRWARGSFPFTGSHTARFDGWVRLARPEPVDAPAILGLLDAWPAPILALVDRPAPASTVTWMVNFVAPVPEGGWPGDAWWRFAADTTAAGEGYADVEGHLWTADGRLVATSRQLVAEFS